MWFQLDFEGEHTKTNYLEKIKEKWCSVTSFGSWETNRVSGETSDFSASSSEGPIEIRHLLPVARFNWSWETKILFKCYFSDSKKNATAGKRCRFDIQNHSEASCGRLAHVAWICAPYGLEIPVGNLLCGVQDSIPWIGLCFWELHFMNWIFKLKNEPFARFKVFADLH